LESVPAQAAPGYPAVASALAVPEAPAWGSEAGQAVGEVQAVLEEAERPWQTP